MNNQDVEYKLREAVTHARRTFCRRYYLAVRHRRRLQQT